MAAGCREGKELQPHSGVINSLAEISQLDSVADGLCESTLVAVGMSGDGERKGQELSSLLGEGGR